MWTVLESPVGDLRVVSDGTSVLAIDFVGAPDTATPPPSPPSSPASSVTRSVARAQGRPLGDRVDADPLLRRCGAELDAYFAGDLKEFDLPLRPHGTPFQLSVWEQLRGIGYGETATYGDVARRLGMTVAASRAVGLANGRNPVPIVIPCHRVVGASGALTGYAGGIDRKRLLLDLERGALF